MICTMSYYIPSNFQEKLKFHRREHFLCCSSNKLFYTIGVYFVPPQKWMAGCKIQPASCLTRGNRLDILYGVVLVYFSESS